MLRLTLLFLFVAVVSAFLQGTGLTGKYYDTATFTTLKTRRTDVAVNRPNCVFIFPVSKPSDTNAALNAPPRLFAALARLLCPRG